MDLPSWKKGEAKAVYGRQKDGKEEILVSGDAKMFHILTFCCSMVDLTLVPSPRR